MFMQNMEQQKSAVMDAAVHLFEEHNNSASIEELMSMYNNECLLRKCAAFLRHNRDRESTEFSSVYGSDDVALALWLSLMDKVHCFILHSFESGVRVRATEQQTIKQAVERQRKEMDKDNNMLLL